jgi:hypothetical protein
VRFKHSLVHDVKGARLRRNDARTAIIQAVNVWKLRGRRYVGIFGYIPPKLLGPKQLQQAVCIARRNRLVKPEVLETAGFRAKERRR